MIKGKCYVSIILSIGFCVSVLAGYIPVLEYVVELTGISNMLIGIKNVCFHCQMIEILFDSEFLSC